MVNVYNYFVQKSDTKKPQKSVAHNPDELNAIYNHIVSLSRNTPLFLLDISEDKQLYAISVKENALLLQVQAKELADFHSDIFTREILVSESPEIVSFVPLRSGVMKFPEDLTIEVIQLACDQQNIGFDLSSNVSGLTHGDYRFAIEKSQQLYEFPYTILKKQTNLDLQNKLADFINKSNIGIKAYVSENIQKLSSTLILENQKKNSKQSESFKIYDINQSKPHISTGIVDYLGLNHRIKPHTQAKFVLNGKELISDTNHYNYVDKLDFSFHQASDKQVLIHSVPDKNNIKEKIQAMTESYNRLIQAAAERKNNRRSSKLINELHKVTERYSQDLLSCGIRKDDSAALYIDTDLFNTAYNTGRIKEVIVTNEGFCPAIAEQASKIALNPMDYLDKIIVTYPDLSPANYPSPYITSIYSGMLFNYYC